jgi:hypothetical protein
MFFRMGKLLRRVVPFPPEKEGEDDMARTVRSLCLFFAFRVCQKQVLKGGIYEEKTDGLL